MLAKYEQIVADFGEDHTLEKFDDEERAVLSEFLEHGRAIREERRRAAEKGVEPNFVPLVRSWGGVSLVYRKRLQDSPAYRLNHEEVQKALEEGIDFVECMNPNEAVPDEYNAVKPIVFERLSYNAENGKLEHIREMHEFPARTVCVAAGTSPNVIYEKKNPARSSSMNGANSSSPTNSSPTAMAAFMSYRLQKARPAFLPHTKRTANSLAITVITIPNTPAMSSRQWHQPNMAIKRWSRSLKMNSLRAGLYRSGNEMRFLRN